jgi:hypothetical protein
LQKQAYTTSDKEKVMLEHILTRLPQEGTSIAIAALAFLFCAALILGFL